MIGWLALSSILSSSPRFSRWPLKPGFGQINITLDSAQGLVVDGLFVAQFDHGVAFCLYNVAGQFFKICREQSADAFFMQGFTAKLPDTVFVFRAKTFNDLGPASIRRF